MGRGLGQWGMQGALVIIADNDAGQMSHPCFSGYLLHQARSNIIQVCDELGCRASERKAHKLHKTR